MDTLWLILRFVVSLAVVIGLIYGLARVKKRVSPKGAGAITLVSKVPVSKKGSLLLVEVGGKTMMLGATDNSITLLSVIDTSAEIDGWYPWTRCWMKDSSRRVHWTQVCSTHISPSRNSKLRISTQ